MKQLNLFLLSFEMRIGWLLRRHGVYRSLDWAAANIASRSGSGVRPSVPTVALAAPRRYAGTLAAIAVGSADTCNLGTGHDSSREEEADLDLDLAPLSGDVHGPSGDDVLENRRDRRVPLPPPTCHPDERFLGVPAAESADTAISEAALALLPPTIGGEDGDRGDTLEGWQPETVINDLQRFREALRIERGRADAQRRVKRTAQNYVVRLPCGSAAASWLCLDSAVAIVTAAPILELRVHDHVALQSAVGELLAHHLSSRVVGPSEAAPRRLPPHVTASIFAAVRALLLSQLTVYGRAGPSFIRSTVGRQLWDLCDATQEYYFRTTAQATAADGEPIGVEECSPLTRCRPTDLAVIAHGLESWLKCYRLISSDTAAWGGLEGQEGQEGSSLPPSLKPGPILVATAAALHRVLRPADERVRTGGDFGVETFHLDTILTLAHLASTAMRFVGTFVLQQPSRLTAAAGTTTTTVFAGIQWAAVSVRRRCLLILVENSTAGIVDPKGDASPAAADPAAPHTPLAASERRPRPPSPTATSLRSRAALHVRIQAMRSFHVGRFVSLLADDLLEGGTLAPSDGGQSSLSAGSRERERPPPLTVAVLVATVMPVLLERLAVVARFSTLGDRVVLVSGLAKLWTRVQQMCEEGRLRGAGEEVDADALASVHAEVLFLVDQQYYYNSQRDPTADDAALVPLPQAEDAEAHDAAGPPRYAIAPPSPQRTRRRASLRSMLLTALPSLTPKEIVMVVRGLLSILRMPPPVVVAMPCIGCNGGRLPPPSPSPGRTARGSPHHPALLYCPSLFDECLLHSVANVVHRETWRVVLGTDTHRPEAAHAVKPFEVIALLDAVLLSRSGLLEGTSGTAAPEAVGGPPLWCGVPAVATLRFLKDVFPWGAESPAVTLLCAALAASPVPSEPPSLGLTRGEATALMMCLAEASYATAAAPTLCGSSAPADSDAVLRHDHQRALPDCEERRPRSVERESSHCCVAAAIRAVLPPLVAYLQALQREEPVVRRRTTPSEVASRIAGASAASVLLTTDSQLSDDVLDGLASIVSHGLPQTSSGTFLDPLSQVQGSTSAEVMICISRFALPASCCSSSIMRPLRRHDAVRAARRVLSDVVLTHLSRWQRESLLMTNEAKRHVLYVRSRLSTATDRPRLDVSSAAPDDHQTTTAVPLLRASLDLLIDSIRTTTGRRATAGAGECRGDETMAANMTSPPATTAQLAAMCDSLCVPRGADIGTTTTAMGPFLDAAAATLAAAPTFSHYVGALMTVLCSLRSSESGGLHAAFLRSALLGKRWVRLLRTSGRVGMLVEWLTFVARWQQEANTPPARGGTTGGTDLPFTELVASDQEVCTFVSEFAKSHVSFAIGVAVAVITSGRSVPGGADVPMDPYGDRLFALPLSAWVDLIDALHAAATMPDGSDRDVAVRTGFHRAVLAALRPLLEASLRHAAAAVAFPGGDARRTSADVGRLLRSIGDFSPELMPHLIGFALTPPVTSALSTADALWCLSRFTVGRVGMQLVRLLASHVLDFLPQFSVEGLVLAANGPAGKLQRGAFSHLILQGWLAVPPSLQPHTGGGGGGRGGEGASDAPSVLIDETSGAASALRPQTAVPVVAPPASRARWRRRVQQAMSCCRDSSQVAAVIASVASSGERWSEGDDEFLLLLRQLVMLVTKWPVSPKDGSTLVDWLSTLFSADASLIEDIEGNASSASLKMQCCLAGFAWISDRVVTTVADEARDAGRIETGATRCGDASSAPVAPPSSAALAAPTTLLRRLWSLLTSPQRLPRTSLMDLATMLRSATAADRAWARWHDVVIARHGPYFAVPGWSAPLLPPPVGGEPPTLDPPRDTADPRWHAERWKTAIEALVLDNPAGLRCCTMKDLCTLLGEADRLGLALTTPEERLDTVLDALHERLPSASATQLGDAADVLARVATELRRQQSVLGGLLVGAFGARTRSCASRTLACLAQKLAGEFVRPGALSSMWRARLAMCRMVAAVGMDAGGSAAQLDVLIVGPLRADLQLLSSHPTASADWLGDRQQLSDGIRSRASLLLSAVSELNGDLFFAAHLKDVAGGMYRKRDAAFRNDALLEWAASTRKEPQLRPLIDDDDDDDDAAAPPPSDHRGWGATDVTTMKLLSAARQASTVVLLALRTELLTVSSASASTAAAWLALELLR